MAGTRRKKPDNLLGRIADLSEEAIQRLSDAPGADKVLGAVNTLRNTVDDLQKRVRGLEQLEKRLGALERKVDKLSKGGAASSSSRSSSTARKTTSTKSSGASSARKKS
jgi:prophage DNA circulation protein